MIEARGEVHHSAGLYLAGISAYNDAIKSWKEGRKFREGENWYRELLKKYRWRDDESHSWFNSFKTAESDYNRVFASCAKWDEKFDKCKGCPFKGVITSPKSLYWGNYLEREEEHEVKLKTPEEIRSTTFVEVEQHLFKQLAAGESQDILLASSQGVGKSVTVDKWACELVAQGKKVLIAVPSTALALEHKARLKACGQDSFVLASHRSIFENKMVSFDCPVFEEIQSLIKLGISSKPIKDTFCGICPFFEECHYPRQYKEVLEEEHKIVIMQHAHLSTAEIVYDLMKKKFDVLFIDESFINSCYSAMPLDNKEIGLLKCFEYKWTKDLVEWLNGNNNFGKELEPPAEELKKVKGIFDNSAQPWRMPDLIRFYNKKRAVNLHMGIEVVYELPQIPIRVFTDATPPEKLIRLLTGISYLKTFGREELIDYQQIHPENRIIQVLDNSTSVSNLANESLFEDILMKIGELMELRFPTSRALVTAYKNDFAKIETFFKLHREEFPTAWERITLGSLDKGTNKYAEFDIQFLLAGFYYTGNQYHDQVYKWKTVSNHYRVKSGLEPLYNVFYEPQKELMSFAQDDWHVERIEMTPGESGKRSASKVKYPKIKQRYPKDEWFQFCQDYNMANTQQAIRIRFSPEKPRYIYLLTDMYFPGFAVTDSIFMRDFIRPLPSHKDLF